MLLDGDRDPGIATDGTPLCDADHLVLVNAWWEALAFALPRPPEPTTWQVMLDSHAPTRSGAAEVTTVVGPRSIVVRQAHSS